jgi:hypothetical protein
VQMHCTHQSYTPHTQFLCAMTAVYLSMGNGTATRIAFFYLHGRFRTMKIVLSHARSISPPPAPSNPSGHLCHHHQFLLHPFHLHHLACCVRPPCFTVTTSTIPLSTPSPKTHYLATPACMIESHHHYTILKSCPIFCTASMSITLSSSQIIRSSVTSTSYFTMRKCGYLGSLGGRHD